MILNLSGRIFLRAACSCVTAILLLSSGLAEADELLYPVEDVSSGLFGYVNAEGAVLISPQFETAQHFREGLAWVRRPNERYGFIDHTGKFIYGPESLHVERAGFSEGLAVIGA